jgi:hypothetical protein
MRDFGLCLTSSKKHEVQLGCRACTQPPLKSMRYNERIWYMPSPLLKKQDVVRGFGICITPSKKDESIEGV